MQNIIHHRSVTSQVVDQFLEAGASIQLMHFSLRIGETVCLRVGVRKNVAQATCPIDIDH